MSHRPLLIFVFLVLVFLNFVFVSFSSSSELFDGTEEIKNPCRLARQRKIPKTHPVIRVIDELTGESPDILLGNGGLRYYILPSGTLTDVVIECSSSLGPVEWEYKGRGATSGFKVVHTKWSSSSPELKTTCYSAALVISNITDQLTGEYTCRTVSSRLSENEFLLFVPQSGPFYHTEGETVNISVPLWTGPVAPERVVLPCISKRRTGSGISLYRQLNESDFIKLDLGPLLKYDPFSGFNLAPTKDLFHQGDARFVCKFDNNIQGFDELQNTTLLHVNLLLRSDEKIAPETSEVRAFSPYFSWTTGQIPRLQLEPNFTHDASIWQQYFTKNDFEEFSSSVKSKVFHLGSLHLLNMTEGAEGSVSLFGENRNGNETNANLIHKWNYHVLDKNNEDMVGLFYEPVEQSHIFTCISATTDVPKFTFRQLVTDEKPLNHSLTNETLSLSEDYTISTCPKQTLLGCITLTTTVPQGEVTCMGDGIHRTVKYPLSFVEPSRPFFIERGETIFVHLDDVVVTLPCLPNAPEAQYSVHLFRKTDDDGYELLWSPKDSEEIEFWPNWGFHIDTSYPDFRDPSGTYICTSSGDIEDMSDAVTVIVYKNVTVSPKESILRSTLPFTLRWTFGYENEKPEELEILESNLENYVIKGSGTGFSNWAKLTLMDDMGLGDITNVTLVRSWDKSVVQAWQFHKIPSSHKSGLDVRTIAPEGEEEKGQHKIEIICRGQVPRLNYFFCQNPNTCEMMKRCYDKNCNPHRRFESNETAIDSCRIENGCVRLVLKSLPLNGFIKAVCKFNGVTEERLISDVFFREEIHWETKEDSDLIYLYVNNALSVNSASTDQNPEREIRSIGSNVDWEIGETVVFTCAAAPFLFSNGVKWALEMKDGTFVYQNDNVFDPQFKYSGGTQVLSSLTLLIDSFELKGVWCFVPSLSTPVEWANASQPIFIRPEIDENCHEAEPSIRLLNLFPPPSKNSLGIVDPRLDNKPYFILPERTQQFAVKITTQEPIEWIFTGYGAGPTMTPLIQSDIHATDFYDVSTYCYTSRMLVNLRHKNINDTGRYVAKFKNHPDTFLAFYLFVTSDNPPYLIRSGAETNETWGALDKSFYLPCLVNNPKIRVQLYRKNELTGKFATFSSKNISYDPTVGYIFQPNGQNPEYLLGTYKCVAGGNQSDSIVINVSSLANKTAELKYEKVGQIHVFTCTSGSGIKPFINFTEHDIVSSEKFMLKDCPDGQSGCAMLMTTSASGTVHCLGDGIDDSYRYPGHGLSLAKDDAGADPSENVARILETKMETKTGLWFDRDSNAFKCQTSSVVPPKLVAVTCRRPNECQVMQGLLRGEGDTRLTTYTKCGDGCGQLQVRQRAKSHWPSNWFSVFVRCRGDDNTEILSQYFHDKNQTVLVEQETVEQFRKIRLDVVSFSRQKGFVHGKFRCFANRYFYSRGIQWALEKHNGNILIQENIPREIEVQSFSATMSEIRMDFDEKIYKGVWCFVPMLGSSKWGNATLSAPIDHLVYDF